MNPLGYSIGFLFSEDRTNLLLIEKIDDGEMNGKLTAPGGCIEAGEQPNIALSREIEEEVGLVINPLCWRFIAALDTVNGRVNIFSYFSDVMYLATPQEGEDEQIVICELSDLPDNLYRNLKWLIPMCLDERVSSSLINYK